MKKRTLSRLLAAFLAVMLLAQSLCLTAFAEETTLEATPEAVAETEPVNETVINEIEVEEPKVEEPKVEEPVAEEPVAEEPVAEEPVVEEPVAEEPVAEEPVVEEPVAEDPETKSEVIPVNIPADSDASTVNRILTKALLGEDAASDTKWEYECIGYSKLLKNTAWGSIEGFTSEVIKTVFGKEYTTTYTHPALAKNDDGFYKVRVAGNTDAVYTIEKSAKLQGSITLHKSPSAALNSVDLKSAIFSAVVAASTPAELTAADVTIKYYATATTGSALGLGKAWVSLDGGKEGGLTYPAIGLGEHEVRISWDGNDKYAGFKTVSKIQITSGKKVSAIELIPDAEVSMVYGENAQPDIAATKATIFTAVVASSTPALALSDVTMEYYATPSSGSVIDIGKKWVPLEGEKGDKLVSLTYPAIGLGQQKIRISWNGDDEYDGFSAETTITLNERPAPEYKLKESPSIKLTYNDDLTVNYTDIESTVFDAIVESTDFSAADVSIEYYAKASSVSLGDIGYKWVPLTGGKVSGLTYPAIGEGTWPVRISWGGSQSYAPVTIKASLTVVDGRIDSQITLKSDASFTYNMDVDTMKQAVLDNVIDWNASTLPAKDTLSLEDFTFEYKASPSILDDVNSDKRPKEYVPFEGGTIILINYPSIGAGVQSIRVTYKGSAEYKPSQPTEGSITVNKAKVKVHVKSASMYVSEAENGLNLVTTTPDDHFNTFVVYAGVTRNVTSAVYLQLPESYTSNQVLSKLLDPILKGLKQPTIEEMLQNGITLGKLRQLLKTQEIVDVLERIGIDTGALGQLIKVIDKLPAVGDDLRIAVGVPNRAGAYSVTAITDNKNYNVGVGVGALVLKADKAKLVWMHDIGKKISAADAQPAVFAAELQKMNGTAVSDQSSVHVLYSGLTSKWKVYSSTTAAPTEPGRYVMTAVVLGGDYQAAPITRSFQITR